MRLAILSHSGNSKNAKPCYDKYWPFIQQYEVLGDELHKQIQDALTSVHMINLGRQLEDVRGRVQKTMFTTT